MYVCMYVCNFPLIFSIGPPPDLPGCMGPLFPADRETVNVGCPVCILQGTYVNLDCGVMSGNTPEIKYSWEHDNVSVSTARILQVRFEGSYTCTVMNLDGMDSATTDVFCRLCVCGCVSVSVCVQSLLEKLSKLLHIIKTPSATQLGQSKNLCCLPHSVSSHFKTSSPCTVNLHIPATPPKHLFSPSLPTLLTLKSSLIPSPPSHEERVCSYL